MTGFLSTAVKVFILGIVAIAPPAILVSIWWPQAVSVIAFASIVGMFSALGRGFSTGALFVSIFAVAATIGVWTGGQPVLAALLVAVMSALVAFFGLRGLAGPMVFTAPLVPYVVHAAISEKPRSGIADNEFLFLLITLFVLLAAGLYAAFIVAKLVKLPSFGDKPQIPSVGASVLYGVLLAGTTGSITFVALTWYPDTYWMWLTLTIYLLTKPTRHLDFDMIFARVGGTFIGSIVALAVISVVEHSAAIYVIAGILMVTALTIMAEKRAYWIYASFLTPAVILLDSAGNGQVTLASERFEFTLLGAVIAVIIGVIMNVVIRWASPRIAADAEAESVAMAEVDALADAEAAAGADSATSGWKSDVAH